MVHVIAMFTIPYIQKFIFRRVLTLSEVPVGDSKSKEGSLRRRVISEGIRLRTSAFITWCIVYTINDMSSRNKVLQMEICKV